MEKENLLGERIAGLKSSCIFVAEKWRKKTYVFISHYTGFWLTLVKQEV